MKKRAITLTELLIAMSIMGFLGTSAVGLLRLTFNSWNKTTAENQAKEEVSKAVRKMEPTIRAAMHIHESSTPSMLVLAMPKKDSNEVVLPLEEGDLISFYLSDKTGKVGTPGTVLWRAKNGVPDKTWSLRNGRPAIDFGSGPNSLKFEYPVTEEPLGVQLAVVAKEDIQGNKHIFRKGTGAGYMRNCPHAEEEEEGGSINAF